MTAAHNQPQHPLLQQWRKHLRRRRRQSERSRWGCAYPTALSLQAERWRSGSDALLLYPFSLTACGFLPHKNTQTSTYPPRGISNHYSSRFRPQPLNPALTTLLPQKQAPINRATLQNYRALLKDFTKKQIVSLDIVQRCVK